MFLWFLIGLSKNYYGTIEYPIEYKNLPNDLVLTNSPGNIDVDGRGQFADGGFVGNGDAPRQGGLRHRPIHGAGVEIEKTEALRDCFADGAFTGSGRAVDGDDGGWG